MTLAAGQVSQGYDVAAVAAHVTAQARPEDRLLLKELGGHWVSSKDVHNSAAVYKAAGPDVRRIGAQETWAEQIDSALRWLLEQKKEEEGKWKARHITAHCDANGEASEGLVFGRRNRLRLLARRGYLTLMDATHNTNGMRWILYTVMIRETHGTWVPGAHILTAKADSNVIRLGLEQVSITSMLCNLFANFGRSNIGAKTPGIFVTCLQATPLVSKVLLLQPFRVGVPANKK